VLPVNKGRVNRSDMKIHQFNSSYFYPRYLNEQEINNPLLVLADFFSIDWLPGHLENLQRWRKYVIEETYYKDKASGPVSLLFTHKLTVRLIEAMYVLNLSKVSERSLLKIHLNFNVQLQLEQSQWIDYPTHLIEEEMINPYLTIMRFFKAYSIYKYSTFLNEWLETALSSSPADETLQTCDIIYVYENLQKLYEAAWIIRQREIDSPILISFEEEEPAVEHAQPRLSKLALVNSDCAFNDTLTIAERLGLNELVKTILASLSSVQMIVHLGTHPSPEAFYLLIITDEKDKAFEHDLVHQIEALCKPMIGVCAIVHKSDAFIRGINEGSRFFYNVLTKSTTAYQSDDIVLPQLQPVNGEHIRAQNEAIWKRWGKQGKDFLDTALNCYDVGNYNLCLFLMHQSVESTLSAIVRINLGYRLAIHNLDRMLRISLMFTDELKNVFDGDADDARLFEVLQRAYSDARYKDDFKPDLQMVKSLTDKVAKLFITAEAIFDHVMKMPEV
jgi:HEPN domain-containing protein